MGRISPIFTASCAKAAEETTESAAATKSSRLSICLSSQQSSWRTTSTKIYGMLYAPATRHGSKPMKSYKVVEFGKPLQKVEEANPAPQGTEVLVRITAAGVCHSDVHLWEGYFDMGGGNKYSTEKTMAPPRTMGHEIGRASCRERVEITGVA